MAEDAPQKIDGPWSLMSDVLSKHGPWAIMAFALAYTAYSCATWLAPRADQVLDSHISTLKAVTESTDRTSRSVEKLTETIGEIRLQHEDDHIMIRDLHKAAFKESKPSGEKPDGSDD